MGTRVMAQPTIVVTNANGGGVGCGCCRCCTCLNLQFLQTAAGMLKIAQMILGGMCQSMLLNFGMSVCDTVGSSYVSMLTTNSASVSMVTLLLVCYVLSQKSFSLIRSSLFETIFNASAVFSYLCSSSYLAFAVNVYLYPLYLVTLGFIAYPAMIAAYMMGYALALLHAVDGYYCYRQYRGYR